MSEANVKTLEIKLERLYADRNQLRKDFIEQSEIATQWRQKHDKLAVQAELLHNDFVKMSELVKEANEAAQEVKIKELDHLFKNPFTKKKPKGWNLKVYPRDEKGRVRKASDFIHKEFGPKPVKGIDHQLRSSEGDKNICDSITVTPVKSVTERFFPAQNAFNIPNPDHF
jgi:outer membrane murein-binding lipoprotein Lpp